MVRFNTKKNVSNNGLGVITTATADNVFTGRTEPVRVLNPEGGVGYQRDAKSELFIAAVSTLNEDTFYEGSDERSERINDLVAKIADDADWIIGLVHWLRYDAGLRSVPVMIAADAVHARLANGQTGQNRDIVRSSMLRLDEPSEFLAYWINTFGRKIPSSVKRGINDVLAKHLTEESYLKWRGKAQRGSMALRDVVNLTHPKPVSDYQSSVYDVILSDAYRHEDSHRTADDYRAIGLSVIGSRTEFLFMSVEDQIAALSGPSSKDIINNARLTHEVIAGSIGKIPAEVWKNLVPFMGYTALRMNLRRMSEAGIDQDTIDQVNTILGDVDKVRSSRTMPMQFLSAYRNAPLDYSAALQRGANGALENVPELSGRTLILVDRSGSMDFNTSEHGTLRAADGANIFAASLALRSHRADVVAFNDSVKPVPVTSNDLLRVAESMPRAGGGTDIRGAVEASYHGQDRVIVLTDEQSWSSNDSFEGIVHDTVPCYTWNLVGYASSHTIAKKNRYTFGGLSDKGFKAILLLEAGYREHWPWE